MLIRKKIRCLIVAVLVGALAVTGISVIPASAGEVEPEVRENVIFSANFEDKSSTLKADGWDEATAWKWYSSGWWEFSGYVSKASYESENVLQFAPSLYSECRAFKKIDINNLKNLTVEFDVISPDSQAVRFGTGSINQTGLGGYQQNIQTALNDILWEGSPTEWTSVRVEFTFEAGSIKATAYTKLTADSEAQYEAADGYSDCSVTGTDAAEAVLNLGYHSAMNGGTKAYFDNVKIYSTYTVIPDDQIVYENKSLFATSFDKNGATLADDGWSEATAWRWYSSGYWEFPGFVYKGIYGDEEVLRFSPTNSFAVCRAVKSIAVENLENLTVEFDIISPDGQGAQFGLGGLNQTGNSGYQQNISYEIGEVLWAGMPATWTRVKVVFSFEAGGIKTTAYAKTVADAEAEYEVVSDYSNHLISGTYAAEKVWNMGFYSSLDAGKSVCLDNIDIYVTHSYKNGKCTACGDYRDGIAALAGYSLTLGDGTIGLNFHMDVRNGTDDTETASSDMEVRFKVDGRDQTVTYEDAPEKDGYRIFTCQVPAKRMADKVTATVYSGNTRGSVYEYSVKEYAEKILADEETYAKEIPLVQAMLNYGSYAQKYFEYHTDDLANGGSYLGTVGLENVTVSTLEPYKSQTALGNDDVKLSAASLVLEARTTLRLYFTIGASVDAETVVCEGESLTKKGAYYYADVVDILPQNLTEDKRVTISYGDSQSVTVTYNCMTYCYNVLNSSSAKETLKNVVRALYLYGQAAAEYAKSAAAE